MNRLANHKSSHRMGMWESQRKSEKFFSRGKWKSNPFPMVAHHFLWWMDCEIVFFYQTGH